MLGGVILKLQTVNFTILYALSIELDFENMKSQFNYIWLYNILI